MKIKAKDPERYKYLKEVNKTACRLYRLEMSVAEDQKNQRNLSDNEKKRLDILIERKRRYNMLARERMKRMRARNKAKAQSKKQEKRKPRTRLDKERHEAKKAKW